MYQKSKNIRCQITRETRQGLLCRTISKGNTIALTHFIFKTVSNEFEEKTTLVKSKLLDKKYQKTCKVKLIKRYSARPATIVVWRVNTPVTSQYNG